MTTSRRAFISSAIGIAPATWTQAASATTYEKTYPTALFPSILDWGVKGNNDPSDGALIQRALDEAPLGGYLYFPPGDFKTHQPLRMRRQLHLIGGGTRITGAFDPNSKDPLLEINIEDLLNRDNRNQLISRLQLSFSSGSGDCLVVNNRPPNIANIGLIIESCLLIGPSDGPGCALRVQGIGSHHLTIRNNQIMNGIYVSAADGVTIEECLIFGKKTGITLDLIPGAFQTRILRNAIVARDGALHVINGSQIFFEHNQVEQFLGYGINKSPQGAHILISPQNYGSRYIHIVSNNFGGGDNAKLSIHVENDCQDLFIDNNIFNISSTGTDIKLANDIVSWTRIGSNNNVRQQGVASRKFPNSNLLQIEDLATGTFGVAKEISSIGNIFTKENTVDFLFWKTLDGIVKFEGAWEIRNEHNKKTIAILPMGFRPSAKSIFLLPTENGEFSTLEIQADGSIFCINFALGMSNFSAVSFRAALRPNYPASDP